MISLYWKQKNIYLNIMCKYFYLRKLLNQEELIHRSVHLFSMALSEEKEREQLQIALSSMYLRMQPIKWTQNDHRATITAQPSTKDLNCILHWTWFMWNEIWATHFAIFNSVHDLFDVQWFFDNIIIIWKLTSWWKLHKRFREYSSPSEKNIYYMDILSFIKIPNQQN